MSSGKVLALFVYLAAFFKATQDADCRAGQGIQHKTAEQRNRWINRRKNKDHHHHQHRHKRYLVMEVDIFEAIVRNIADHHQAGENDDR